LFAIRALYALVAAATIDHSELTDPKHATNAGFRGTNAKGFLSLERSGLSSNVRLRSARCDEPEAGLSGRLPHVAQLLLLFIDTSDRSDPGGDGVAEKLAREVLKALVAVAVTISSTGMTSPLRIRAPSGTKLSMSENWASRIFPSTMSSELPTLK
jgi:hypothetical protein